MKTKHIAKQLLEGVNLSQTDAARLTLEAIESLDDLAQGLSRAALLTLLRDTLRHGVAAIRAATNTVTLREAVAASISARQHLRPSSMRDLKHFTHRILKVEGCAELPLRTITTAQCKKILTEAFASSASNFVKGRAILHGIFSYGIQQEWCDANPVSRIEVPKVQENPIVPLTPAAAKELRETAKRAEFRDMQLSLCLMLYSGIRPTEVSRLQDGDFDWDNMQVIIRPSTSKTGGGRIVPIRGVQGIRKNERIIPQNWSRKWQALRRAAGYRGRSWVSDVCRHTFASYHAAYFNNLPALQHEMGHRNLSLLMTRYMAPALRKDAAAFWRGAGCLKE